MALIISTFSIMALAIGIIIADIDFVMLSVVFIVILSVVMLY
jgi:hypothetical protein